MNRFDRPNTESVARWSEDCVIDYEELEKWAEELAKECPNPDCICKSDKVR